MNSAWRLTTAQLDAAALHRGDRRGRVHHHQPEQAEHADGADQQRLGGRSDATAPRPRDEPRCDRASSAAGCASSRCASRPGRRCGRRCAAVDDRSPSSRPTGSTVGVDGRGVRVRCGGSWCSSTLLTQHERRGRGRRSRRRARRRSRTSRTTHIRARAAPRRRRGRSSAAARTAASIEAASAEGRPGNAATTSGPASPIPTTARTRSRRRAERPTGRGPCCDRRRSAPPSRSRRPRPASRAARWPWSRRTSARHRARRPAAPGATGRGSCRSAVRTPARSAPPASAVAAAAEHVRPVVGQGAPQLVDARAARRRRVRAARRRPRGSPAAAPSAPAPSPKRTARGPSGPIGQRSQHDRVLGVGDRHVVGALVGPDPRLRAAGRPPASSCTSRWSSAKFSQVATVGRNRRLCARRNDEASTTNTSVAGSSIAATSGTSVLPTAALRTPDASSIASTSVVTVVLPLVPVIGQHRPVVPGLGQVELAEDGHAGVAGGGEQRGDVRAARASARRHRPSPTSCVELRRGRVAAPSGPRPRSTPRQVAQLLGDRRQADRVAVVGSAPPRGHVRTSARATAVLVTPMPCTRKRRSARSSRLIRALPRG